MKNTFAVLFLLCLGHFIVDFMIGIWPVYKTMAGLDLAIAGLIAAGCAGFGEAMQIIFGNLSDRGWRKTLILAGVSASSIAAFFAYTTDYFFLFFLCFGVCLGSAAFHPAAVGLVTKLTQDRKSFYVSLFAVGGALGLASSQIIYSTVYGAFDGQTFIFLIPAALLSLFCMQKHLLRSPVKAPHKKIELKQFFSFFRHRGLKLLYISQLCSQAVAWSLIFLLPDILKAREYDNWIVYGGAHLCYILGGAVAFIPSGLLADRYSSRSVILAASIFGVSSLYLFLCLPDLSNGLTLILLFFMGSMIGTINPISVAFGTKLMPEHPGMVSAFLMGGVWCVSESLGPGGSGLLTKLFEEDAPARALMIVGVFFFAGIFVAYRLPHDKYEAVEIA